MASLTGQTIASTYDSLLKVSDNGPLTSTYKEIQDGFGNGSGLYIATGGRLGIGTASPTALLSVSGAASSGGATNIQLFNTQVGSNNFSLNYTSTGFSANGVGASESLLLAADSGALSLATWANNPIKFIANSSERMRITSAGNVGIGTSSPQVTFHSYGGALTVGNEATYSARFSNNSNKGVVIGYDTTNNKGHIGSINPAVAWTDLILNANGGNVGIGTTSPGYTLHVNGSVAGTSAYVNLSDERYKKDIQPIENALAKILSLNGVTFNWDKSNTDMNLDDANHIGLIAQEVEKVLPQAVTTGNDDNEIKSVAYTDIVPVLIEAIKEQQAQIEELKAKLN